MARQIIINAAPWETRVAVLDDTTLSELYVERASDRGIAGNIYKGKVVRVLPGMQAAFVDVGLEKAAFLHVSDLLPPDEPVAWGYPNSAMTGRNRWMMLREEVPSDDQYSGAMWVPLYAAPKA